MNKRFYILLILLCGIVSVVRGESHGLQIAPAGGASMFVGDGSTKIGAAGGLQVCYALRMQAARDIYLGLRTGLGASIVINQFEGSTLDQYTNIDYLGHPIAYQNTAHVSAAQKRLQFSLPVMGTLSLYGLTLGIGPKVQYMTAGEYTQTLSDVKIEATYTEYGVKLTNEQITGKLDPARLANIPAEAKPMWHVVLSGEVGYEWHVHAVRGFHTAEHWVGLQAYVDYSIWNNGKASQSRLIDVAPITSPVNPIPEVKVGSFAEYTASNLHYMEFGLRLYYALHTVDYNYHGWHRH